MSRTIADFVGMVFHHVGASVPGLPLSSARMAVLVVRADLMARSGPEAMGEEFDRIL
jgi:hypothetical protein